MNYNSDSLLWENYRKTTTGNPVLTVLDDGTVTQGGEPLARCTDKRSAMTMLASAGWQHMDKNTLGVFYTR